VQPPADRDPRVVGLGEFDEFRGRRRFRDASGPLALGGGVLAVLLAPLVVAVGVALLVVWLAVLATAGADLAGAA
jgi:hypothetical protein